LTVTQTSGCCYYANNLFWVFLLEWYWLYNYSAGTRIAKDVLLINLTWLWRQNQRMLLLQTICSGESFSWNGTDYTTQAGTESLKMAVLQTKY
jgi:hypothetical protein